MGLKILLIIFIDLEKRDHNLNEFKCIDYIDLDLKDKVELLKWRNNDKIRFKMFDYEKINEQNHLNFIKTLNRNKKKKYFLVKENKNNIGTINFTGIDINNKSADLGLYLNPEYLNKGYGKKIMLVLEKKAIKLNLRILYLKVKKDNINAIRLYKEFKYEEIDETDEYIEMKKRLG